MYELLTLVGIAFWVTVAAYFAIRGILALRGLHLKTLASVRKEKSRARENDHKWREQRRSDD